MAIVHRLDRGPFSGLVAKREHGPWRGWYMCSWTAGGEFGISGPTSKAYAEHKLYLAMLAYFARQQPELK